MTCARAPAPQICVLETAPDSGSDTTASRGRRRSSGSKMDDVLFARCAIALAHDARSACCGAHAPDVSRARRSHAQVFVFDREGNTWADKGVGQAYVLQHKGTQHRRVLIQRTAEGVTLANHIINPTMKLVCAHTHARRWRVRAQRLTCAPARPCAGGERV